MRSLKLVGTILLALFLGFVGGLYTSEMILLNAVKDLESKNAEYQNLISEIEADDNFYDNLEAFDQITVLQHAEKNNSEKIKEFLIPKLIHRYRLALEWSQSASEDELYRKLNASFIEKIDELSQESELFGEIRENARKDS